jgi:threonine/homoserine/homoserine lactone efflux protein
MDWDGALTLLGIAVSMTWTPGPNNAMLTASGANFGWRRTIPHMMGVAFGLPIMLFVVSLGLGQVFEAEPLIGEVLGWIGFAAVLWFAWRIANAGKARAEKRSRPLTFVEAAGFQWVNPKAWTFVIWVVAGYVSPERIIADTLVACGAFLLSGLGSTQVWTLFGVGIGKVLGSGWRLRAFNIAMALLLVASGVWLMIDR